MQDLSIIGPFLLTGLALIAAALMFARQTSLSGRKLDAMIAASSRSKLNAVDTTLDIARRAEASREAAASATSAAR